VAIEFRKLNPRSFASIRKAVREGHLTNRGQLLREIYNAFRTPKEKEAPPTVLPKAPAAPKTSAPKAEAGKAAKSTVRKASGPVKASPAATPLGTKEKATITERKDGAIK